MIADTACVHESRQIDLSGLVANIKDYYRLTPLQRENIGKMLALSRSFERTVGLPQAPIPGILSPETVILESGHQPNFLPHCGTWKKAFLLDRIRRELSSKDIPVIAFFGFADRNLSTAKLLVRNHIPLPNKEGARAIGFGIPESARLKEFCTLPKPPNEIWEKEMERIRQHYLTAVKNSGITPARFKLQFQTIEEILWESYNRSETFADLNCHIFARISSDIFGINIHFFRYSAVQKEGLFLEESRRLLANLALYNREYNQVITDKGLKIPRVPSPGSFPFWYMCSCGTKLDVTIDDTHTARVVCPSCGNEYLLDFGQDFSLLAEYYCRMDFQAVSRDVVLSEGLGDSLFIPGCGGSAAYGEISRRIADRIGFHHSNLLSWKSRDYYLGMNHTIALNGLLKTSGSSFQELTSSAFRGNLERTIIILSENVSLAESASVDKREILRLKNQVRNLTNLRSTVQKMFSLTPSVLDVLVNVGGPEMTRQWDDSLSCGVVCCKGEGYLLVSDVIYASGICPEVSPKNIPVVYRSMQNLGGFCHD